MYILQLGKLAQPIKFQFSIPVKISAWKATVRNGDVASISSVPPDMLWTTS